MFPRWRRSCGCRGHAGRGSAFGERFQRLRGGYSAICFRSGSQSPSRKTIADAAAAADESAISQSFSIVQTFMDHAADRLIVEPALPKIFSALQTVSPAVPLSNDSLPVANLLSAIDIFGSLGGIIAQKSMNIIMPASWQPLAVPAETPSALQTRAAALPAASSPQNLLRDAIFERMTEKQTSEKHHRGRANGFRRTGSNPLSSPIGERPGANGSCNR